MKKYQDLFYSVFLFILSLLAVRWLFAPGFLPTHDGEYHLIRIHEYYEMLRQGYLFPRWAPSLNSGYGVPLFNFFYPFPSFFGSFIHFFGVSLAHSFMISLGVGYITSVLFCYFWLKKLFQSSFTALGGSVIFAFMPYWFVEIYVRGSIGEVLAIALYMGAFTAVEARKKTPLSIFIALAILSHNILTMIFLPILLAYSVMRKRQVVSAIVWGIGIAGFFWIPALLERSYVTGLNTVNYLDHFASLFQLIVPSWGTGFSVRELTFDEMSFQVGIVPILILVFSAFMLLRRNRRAVDRIAVFFIGIFALVFFLMLEVSIPVWETVVPLQLLQYPWRLLSIVLPVVAVLSAYIFSQISKKWITAVFGISAIILVWPYTRPVLYAPRTDQYYLSRREFTDGTSSLANGFSTIWTQSKTERPLSKVLVLEGSGTLSVQTITSVSYKISADMSELSTVRFNGLYYPGWNVYVDDAPVSVFYEAAGLIDFFVPTGVHTVLVRFEETPMRKAIDLLSFVCLFWVVGSAILNTIYAHRNRHKSPNQRE